MPKVNRVILALTRNKNYTGYWNYVSEIWATKFGVIPTLIFYGDPGEKELCNLSEAYGEIVCLPRIPEVTLNLEREWACTWGLFFGASLYCDEICMLSGIDQIPLGGLFFDHLQKVPSWPDKYAIGFGDAYQGTHFPSSHHVARGSKFREIYDLNPCWQIEVTKVFSTRWRWACVMEDAWCLDEAYSSSLLAQRIKQHQDVHPMDIFWRHWHPNRLERETVLTDMHFDGISKGQFSEWHGLRPFERNDPAVLERLKATIPVYSWA